jgi:hypothetical protein
MISRNAVAHDSYEKVSKFASSRQWDSEESMWARALFLLATLTRIAITARRTLSLSPRGNDRGSCTVSGLFVLLFHADAHQGCRAAGVLGRTPGPCQKCVLLLSQYLSAGCAFFFCVLPGAFWLLSGVWDLSFVLVSCVCFLRPYRSPAAGCDC